MSRENDQLISLMDDEERLIYDYHITKRITSKSRKIEYNLDPFWIRYLLRSAGISIKDIGKSAEEYCLGRHNDVGPYEIGNCEFITQRENYVGAPKKRIRCGDRIFSSLTEAAKSEGITKGGIYQRLRNPKYPEWEYFS